MGALGEQIGLGLLDSTYTPQRTPDLYVNSNGQYVDATGKPSTPYTPPSWINRVVSPTARQIANLNAESSLAPLEAQRQNAIRNTIGGSNFAKMRAAGVTGQGFADVPDDVGFMANPSMSPSVYTSEGTGILNNRGGLQGLTSNTDIGSAQYNLEHVKRALSRQQVSEAGLDQDTINALHASTHLTPTVTDNAIARAKGEAGRMTREQSLLGTQIDAANLGADVDKSLAMTRKDMTPVLQDTLATGLYNEGWGVHHQPVPGPLSVGVDSHGVRTTEHTPGGMNAALTGMAGIPGAPDPLATMGTIPLSSGRSIVAPRGVKPTVNSYSDRPQYGPLSYPSSPSSRPTVQQTAVQQNRPQTTNVADSQAQQFRPLVGSGVGTNTYRMPDNTEAWLKNAYNADVPVIKVGAVHTGRALANLLRLLEAQPMEKW